MNTTNDSIQYRQSFIRNRHGSLYNRGSADSYYNRIPVPHWYPYGTYVNERITELTEDQKAEYMMGYNNNEAAGNKKDWGN